MKVAMTRRPRRLRRCGLAIAAAVVLAAPVATAPPALATPGALSVTTLGETLTPTLLAQDLAGEGVTVSDVTYAGVQTSAGRFVDSGTVPDLILGLQSGVILSSGGAPSVVGGNDATNTSTNNAAPGDADLSNLLPDQDPTFDATTLAFTFVPDGSSISFRFVFASEEYNEFVDAGVDDVFGFFINGTNCATIDGQRISIDTINAGSHAELFRNNEPPSISTEMDGLTTVLTCTAPVNADVPNTMKLSIADVGDSVYDSNVFIETGSLTTNPPGNAPPVAQDGSVTTPQDTPAGVTLVATDDDDDPLTFDVTSGPANGELSGVAPDLTYTPAPGFTGSDAFTFVANDGTADSNEATVSIVVTPPGTTFSMTVDTSQGGILLIDPEGAADLGTSGKIKIPPQPGPPTEVTVTATLFGVPGETDATCGGNVCIGQGIEWSVSDPDAVKRMRVKFIEAPSLTHGGSAQDAIAYKDGVPVGDCPTGVPDRFKPKPCIVWRYTTRLGLWQITFLVDGDDPKGRI